MAWITPSAARSIATASSGLAAKRGKSTGSMQPVTRKRSPISAGFAAESRYRLTIANCSFASPASASCALTKSGEHSVFATHAGDHKIVAPNYLLFDHRGRLYVTDSGNWMKRNGFVIRFNPDGNGTVLAGPFGYANGLALTADRRHLFVVESDSDSILRFEIGADDNLSEPDVYADQVGRLPDGIALDVEGNLYACCYASDEIWRINPDREKSRLAHDRWGILLGRPTNLAFGGTNFDEIFVANLGRYTITRANVGVRGQCLANQQGIR